MPVHRMIKIHPVMLRLNLVAILNEPKFEKEKDFIEVKTKAFPTSQAGHSWATGFVSKNKCPSSQLALEGPHSSGGLNDPFFFFFQM